MDPPSKEDAFVNSHHSQGSFEVTKGILRKNYPSFLDDLNDKLFLSPEDINALETNISSKPFTIETTRQDKYGYLVTKVTAWAEQDGTITVEELESYLRKELEEKKQNNNVSWFGRLGLGRQESKELKTQKHKVEEHWEERSQEEDDARRCKPIGGRSENNIKLRSQEGRKSHRELKGQTSNECQGDRRGKREVNRRESNVDEFVDNFQGQRDVAYPAERCKA